MRGLGLGALCAALIATAAAAGPAAASNGGLIAFASGDPSHVWTVKPNGKALHDLNAGAPADKTYCGPALSPDGSRVAYVDYGTKPPLSTPNSNWSELIVASSDGSGARVIQNAWVYASGCVNVLSWSPDGHSIAYIGGGATLDTGAVFIVNVDNPVLPPRGVGDVDRQGWHSLTWSPDGTRIAARADSGERIFWLDEHAPPVVSSNYCDATSWSPDSARLLESCYGPPSTAEAQGTWSVRASDLGDEQPVYLGPAYDATYSPDGSRIAIRLNGDIATIPADGSAPPTVIVPKPPPYGAYGISWGG